MKETWVSLIVFFSIIVYNLIGGAVFQALEQDYETQVRSRAIRTSRTFLSNYTCVDLEGLQQLLQAYEDALNNGISFTISSNGSTEAVYTPSPSNWDYWNSFFFGMTAMTTIGYGNISPSTSAGKVFVCVYALIGIPLFGILMTMIGQKLGKPCSKLHEKLGSACNLQDKPKTATALFFFMMITSGFLVFFAMPAVIFAFAEGWTFGTGVYYAFITLTTIGFGDFVAGQQEIESATRIIYKVLLCLWIIVGLSYMALIIDQISTIYKKGVSKINKQKSKDEAIEVSEFRRKDSSETKAENNNAFAENTL